MTRSGGTPVRLETLPALTTCLMSVGISSCSSIFHYNVSIISCIADTSSQSSHILQMKGNLQELLHRGDAVGGSALIRGLALAISFCFAS